MSASTGRPLVDRVIASRWFTALVGLYVLLILFWLVRVPLGNADTLRDLLMARGCVDLGKCPRQGPPGGLGHFQQDATWIWILVGARMAHLGTYALHLAAIAGAALAATLVYASARRFASTAPALLGAVVFALAARSMVPLELLDNPTFLPLAAACMAFLMLRMVERRLVRDAVWTALALAFCVEFHGVAALLLVPFVVCVALYQRRPWLSLFASALAIVTVLWNVSRDAFESNIARALSYPVMALGAVALLLLFVGLLLLRPRIQTHGVERRRWFALLPAVVHPLLVFGLVRAFGEDIPPYYLVPALPFLAVLLAALVERWLMRAQLQRRTTRGILMLLVAVPAWTALQSEVVARAHARRAQCERGLDLAQLAALARALSARGYDYQNSFVRVQMARRAALIASVAAFEPRSRSGAPAPGPLLDVFALSRGRVPKGIDRVELPGHVDAALVSVHSWLDRTHLTACTAPADGSGRQHCVGVLVLPSTPALRGTDLAARAYPRIEDVEQAVRSGRLGEWPHRGTIGTYRFAVHVGAGTGRVIALADASDTCAWNITRVEGVAHEGALPGRVVVLRKGGGDAGSLEVSRRSSERCPVGMPRMPPPLLEVSRDDSSARALLDRCRSRQSR